jgi:hypothetical protein
MHSHPAKYPTTVAINALWCLLIALALLALPFVARQMRLQTRLAPQRAEIPPTAQTPSAQPPTSGAVLVSLTESPPATH